MYFIESDKHQHCYLLHKGVKRQQQRNSLGFALFLCFFSQEKKGSCFFFIFFFSSTHSVSFPCMDRYEFHEHQKRQQLCFFFLLSLSFLASLFFSLSLLPSSSFKTGLRLYTLTSFTPRAGSRDPRERERERKRDRKGMQVGRLKDRKRGECFCFFSPCTATIHALLKRERK